MDRGSNSSSNIAEGWILEGKDGSDRTVRLQFSETELAESDFGLTIGRHPKVSHRVIDDPSVSRRHLRVSLRNGKLCLEDLNTLNGSLLNERLLAPFEATEAREGQSVILGAVSLRILESAD
jgi:predicted component of type VI protein secretion system